MKSYNTFKGNHPLIAMIIFDIVASAVAFVVAYLLHVLTGIGLSTVIIMEGILFLVIAQSSVMGNTKLKTESDTVYREFTPDDSHNSAYFVALKYGIVGVILFSATWFI